VQRVVLALAVLGGLVLWIGAGVTPPPAFGNEDASEPPPDEDVDVEADGTFGDSFDLGGSRGGNQGESAPSPQPVGNFEPPPEPDYVLYEPSWGTNPETDEPCIELTPHEYFDDEPSQGLMTDYEHRTLQMMSDTRLFGVDQLFCSPEDQEGQGDSPAAVAQAFIRTLGIPAPEPRIDPGWALTGMPSYLEIMGQDGFSHVEEIDGFGRLEVTFEPTYFEVDWGDGTVEYIDDGRTGAPYDGPEHEQISHTYSDVREDNVVQVTARWHARWELAGFSGVVGGLETSEDFPLEVREMQSVRTS
jgi:hypothetical protein